MPQQPELRTAVDALGRLIRRMDIHEFHAMCFQNTLRGRMTPQVKAFMHVGMAFWEMFHFGPPKTPEEIVTELQARLEETTGPGQDDTPMRPPRPKILDDEL